MSQVQSVPQIDTFTRQMFAVLEKAESTTRIHCQDDDCYRLSDVADIRTSLHYCLEHYWRKQDKSANWESLNLRDYHE